MLQRVYDVDKIIETKPVRTPTAIIGSRGGLGRLEHVFFEVALSA